MLLCYLAVGAGLAANVANGLPGLAHQETHLVFTKISCRDRFAKMDDVLQIKFICC